MNWQFSESFPLYFCLCILLLLSLNGPTLPFTPILANTFFFLMTLFRCLLVQKELPSCPHGALSVLSTHILRPTALSTLAQQQVGSSWGSVLLVNTGFTFASLFHKTAGLSSKSRMSSVSSVHWGLNGSHLLWSPGSIPQCRPAFIPKQCLLVFRGIRFQGLSWLSDHPAYS